MKRSVQITYLEMRTPPQSDVRCPEGVRIERVDPTIRFYRFLYDAVGQDWHWVDRKRLSDQELGAIVRHHQVEVHVMYVDRSPAGYVEFDLRQSPEVEIAYFGLMPEFLGRGLGRFLIHWAIQEAFQRQPSRVWLHTCELDHPAALSNYQKAGFRIYDRRTVEQEV